MKLSLTVKLEVSEDGEAIYRASLADGSSAGEVKSLSSSISKAGQIEKLMIVLGDELLPAASEAEPLEPKNNSKRK